jgi:hypothetical protein
VGVAVPDLGSDSGSSVYRVLHWILSICFGSLPGISSRPGAVFHWPDIGTIVERGPWLRHSRSVQKSKEIEGESRRLMAKAGVMGGNWNCINAIKRAEVAIIDDIGAERVTPGTTEALCRVLHARRHRRQAGPSHRLPHAPRWERSFAGHRAGF